MIDMLSKLLFLPEFIHLSQTSIHRFPVSNTVVRLSLISELNHKYLMTLFCVHLATHNSKKKTIEAQAHAIVLH